MEIEVKDRPIESQDVTQVLGAPAHGAQTVFCGVVRDYNLGKEVRGVEYDCYEPLTKKVFIEIANEAKGKWGKDALICIFHAKGYLNVGQMSVGIGVSTPHRSEAFDACRYIIEQIKERAPIWKKEYYLDGESDWVKGHALCQKHRKSDSGHTGRRTFHADGPQ